MIKKTLDEKLSRMQADPYCGEFILADAKDADMAFGIAGPGEKLNPRTGETQFRSLQEYRDLIRENIRQGLIDIMLMSVSTSELLTIQERCFVDSSITPAVRANDTTDIWVAQEGVYPKEPSRPFRSATLDIAMCGKPACDVNERPPGADLGLYSITFNNHVAMDKCALEEYGRFRREASAKGFRHFLELFDPNAPMAPIEDIGRFMNDMTVRTIAGVAAAERPLFLKVVYHGPAAMEQLASYDSSLVVGIMGGSSGTTYDAFHQLWEAKRYGARAALYGRMINNAEHQPSFIRHLKALIDGHLEPAEAVRSYHHELAVQNIQPRRPLADDVQSSTRVGSYGGKTATTSQQAKSATVTRVSHTPIPQASEPPFSEMTQAEKLAWNQARWKRIYG